MGFCRRCGDIVNGARCKCGGSAVAPALQWNPTGSVSKLPDRWSQTYVTKPKDNSPTNNAVVSLEESSNSSSLTDPPSSSVRRFPRPQTTSTTVEIGARVSAHINKTTTSRPSSPLKRGYSIEDSSTDILPSPHGSILAKAYGSVLQPKETLATFTCSICTAPFAPDATIYPDPLATEGNNRYLCRPCFVSNGGSKGDCESCHRPVLVLKSEGGFIENSERLWHKRCFRCEGCFKDISEHPMVDLLGKPSCAECFDTCLKRDSPRRHESPRAQSDEKRDNLGGLRSASRSRQGIPALEELEQRLDKLNRSRENSPMMGDMEKFSRGISSPTRDSPTRSPLGTRYSTPYHDDSPLMDRVRSGADSEFTTPSRLHDGSPVRRTYDRFKSSETEEFRQSPRLSDSPTALTRQSTDKAVDEMKRRFLDSARSSPSSSPRPATLPVKEVRKTPQSRIPVASRNSVSPPLKRSTSAISLRPDSKLLSFADSSSSSTIPLRPESSVSSFSQDSDILCSELLSTPDPFKSAIPALSLHAVTSMGSLRQEPNVLLSTPELGSEFSDSTSTTFSSGPSTPPSISPPSHRDNARYENGDSDVLTITPMPKPKHPSSGMARPTSISPTVRCEQCNMLLLAQKHGGQFVTVPDGVGAPSKMYHPQCFRCSVCHGVFNDNNAGQAVFVRSENGVCHVDCAPKEKVTIRPSKLPSATNPHSSTTALSGRYDHPPPSTPRDTTAFPKFGGGMICPGCHMSVSTMERGVVPGPAGTRWHSTCLVCGGKDRRGRGGRRDKDEPGCGKKLDSAAKSDGDGGVWCRECSLLLPPSSPTRSPIASSNTGSIWAGQTTMNRRVDSQLTGTTTLARQFTVGLGESLIRQMTGGSLSPTRQLSSSPTKQLGKNSGAKYGRPKSVIGMRGEGRGMRLVQQMTGGRERD